MALCKRWQFISPPIEVGEFLLILVKNKYIGNAKYRQGSAVPGRSVQSMAGAKRLPVGLDDFKKIRENGFYYVDKTKLLEELLQNWGKVNFFTRPRRFGKNLKGYKKFIDTQKKDGTLAGTDQLMYRLFYVAGNSEEFPVT